MDLVGISFGAFRLGVCVVCVDIERGFGRKGDGRVDKRGWIVNC